MPLAPEIRAAWTHTKASPLFWGALWLYNVGLGAALAFGGPRRVSTASFSSVRDYGGYMAWGLAFIVVGVLIAAAPFVGRRFLGIALTVAGVAHLLMAAGFIAATSAPDAAITGALTYPFVAAIHALHGWHYRRFA